MPLITRPTLALACLALALSACTTPATELVVVVDTDFAIPSELDAIHVVVTRPDGTMADEMTMLAGRSLLPLTLGVVADGETLGPIDVVAEGRHAGASVVSRRARVTLVRHESRVLLLHLVRSCVGVTCPANQTCTETGCRATAIPDLPSWTGTAPRLGEDAGVRDAGRSDGGDAGVGDAGPIDANLPDAGPCTSDTQCDDHVPCTTDSCASTRCQHTPSDALCEDGNPCTDGICSPSGCVQADNTAPCGDTTFCNGVDVCAAGVCTHPGDPCVAPTTCDETMDVCRGCVTRAQCPADVTGTFTSCDYADGCDESAMQQRTDVVYACVSGDCTATPMTVTMPCSRDTDGASCGMGSCGAFGACSFGSTCAESGLMTQTCTDLLCGAGVCRGVDRPSTMPCSRMTEGSSCGSSSCGGYDDCDYTDVCDQNASHSRTCSDPVCRSSSCGSTSHAESEACSRNTDGVACGASATCSGGSCVSCVPTLGGSFGTVGTTYMKNVTGSGSALVFQEGAGLTSGSITAGGGVSFSGSFVGTVAVWQVRASGNQITFVDWNGSTMGVITVSGATVSGTHAPPCVPTMFGCFPPTIGSVSASGNVLTLHASDGSSTPIVFGCP